MTRWVAAGIGLRYGAIYLMGIGYLIPLSILALVASRIGQRRLGAPRFLGPVSSAGGA